jgi:DNA-binding Lrp family transcriptional regulator
MVSLDRLDGLLLYELDCDARQSASALSRKLREGRDRVEYRINRLKQEGVIRKCTAVINPYKLGLTNYKTYLKIENDSKYHNELLQYLKKHRQVYWTSQCDGHWDVQFGVLSRSPFEFQMVQDEILHRFHRIIMSFNVYTVVNSHYYTKQLFINRPGRTLERRDYYYVGGIPETQELSSLDTALLRNLAVECRTSYSALARVVDTTPIVVKYRIDRLIRLGIILGFRIDVDLEKIGISYFKTQLFLKNYDLKDLDKLKLYCIKVPHIAYYVEQLGECKIELEIQARGYQEYYTVIDALCDSFPKLIRNTETTHIRREELKPVSSVLQQY